MTIFFKIEITSDILSFKISQILSLFKVDVPHGSVTLGGVWFKRSADRCSSGQMFLVGHTDVIGVAGRQHHAAKQQRYLWSSDNEWTNIGQYFFAISRKPCKINSEIIFLGFHAIVKIF